METMAYDPYLTEEGAKDLGIERVELDDVIARGDVISLHVPLTPQTEGMIGEAQLKAMKPTAILINASRGGVVEEDALVAALESGEIAAAALDVYTTEPLPEDSPLRGTKNLVLTPHLGASTAEAQELVAREIAQGVSAALLEGDLSKAPERTCDRRGGPRVSQAPHGSRAQGRARGRCPGPGRDAAGPTSRSRGWMRRFSDR